MCIRDRFKTAWACMACFSIRAGRAPIAEGGPNGSPFRAIRPRAIISSRSSRDTGRGRAVVVPGISTAEPDMTHPFLPQKQDEILTLLDRRRAGKVERAGRVPLNRAHAADVRPRRAGGSPRPFAFDLCQRSVTPA